MNFIEMKLFPQKIEPNTLETVLTSNLSFSGLLCELNAFSVIVFQT